MKTCVIDNERIEYNEETQRPVVCGSCIKWLRIVNNKSGDPFFERCEECKRKYGDV